MNPRQTEVIQQLKIDGHMHRWWARRLILAVKRGYFTWMERLLCTHKRTTIVGPWAMWEGGVWHYLDGTPCDAALRHKSNQFRACVRLNKPITATRFYLLAWNRARQLKHIHHLALRAPE